MKIAVLDYFTKGVSIIDAPNVLGTTEEIEDYLSDMRGYHLDQIAYMADVKYVSSIEL